MYGFNDSIDLETASEADIALWYSDLPLNVRTWLKRYYAEMLKRDAPKKEQKPRNGKLEYSGAYVLPDQLKPIVNDMLDCILTIKQLTPAHERIFGNAYAYLNLESCTTNQKFHLEIKLAQNDFANRINDWNDFVNRIIDSLIRMLSQVSENSVLTFELHAYPSEIKRTFKLVFEDSEEELDNPFED